MSRFPLRVPRLSAAVLACLLPVWPAAAAPGAEAGLSAPAAPASAFSPEQMSRVTGWIQERAPGYPPETAPEAARDFLENLQELHPDALDRVAGPDFPLKDFESDLLRRMAAHLAGPAFAPLREDLARRRLESWTARHAGTAPQGNAVAEFLAALRGGSSPYYRRLLDGRLDDDDLATLWKRLHADAAKPAGTGPAKPAELTAADIVAQFVHHNQQGASVEHLQAYTIEGTLQKAGAAEQHLVVFRMRPDRFRVVISTGGVARYVLAGEGGRFWHEDPEHPPQEVPADVMGDRRLLGEFVDPLFAAEGYRFERLPDGAEGAQRFLRIGVRRADGSHYVARLDPDSYHETGREEADGSRTVYSDFRDMGGMTVAFREESTDAKGGRRVFTITRATANPGLLADFFQPAPRSAPDFFQLDGTLTRAADRTVPAPAAPSPGAN